MKRIATIIKSVSHLDYVAQVINPRVQSQITNADYSLGSFVLIGAKSVGVIYDTELFNPNSLTLSSQKEQVTIFAPDLRDEVDVLLKILLLGSLEKNNGKQELPTESLDAGMEVVRMTDESVKTFHLNSEGKPQVRYLTNLSNHAVKLNPGLFSCISSQLKGLFTPAQFSVIEVIERNLQWTNLAK